MSASSFSLCSTSHHQINGSPTFAFRVIRLSPKYSSQAQAQIDTQQGGSQSIKINPDAQVKKKLRKPKPSFYGQISEKWSCKPTISTSFPWHQELEEEGQDDEVEWPAKEVPELNTTGYMSHNDRLPEPSSFASTASNGGGVKKSVAVTPWGRRPRINQLDSEQKLDEKLGENLGHDLVVDKSIKSVENSAWKSMEFASGTGTGVVGVSGENRLPEPSSFASTASNGGGVKKGVAVTPWGRRPRINQLDSEQKLDEKLGENLGHDLVVDKSIKSVENSAWKLMEFASGTGVVDVSGENSASSTLSGVIEKSFGRDGALTGGRLQVVDADVSKPEASSEASCNSQPWKARVDSGDKEEGRPKRNNAELAEKAIPEHELKRLRNLALRMVERTKVGEAGITQALVDAIHLKWNFDEIVKLKFEGSPAVNMKRTHETLERKTGGLVIWRSGGSVVLFRGMNYKFECVHSYNKQRNSDMRNQEIYEASESKLKIGGMTDVESFKASEAPDSLDLPSCISDEELMDTFELKSLLDELGPPFEDWTGRDPKPVDADLLPGVVPGYKTPFRLLPYGMRHSLKNKEMTFFRKQARWMPPHFALGRNKELQGLAAAMVKLWEKSAIAKIAIKRGVLNTCNDKMAEDLKKLTGGTLLSRNKEFIVFYRGNDFLPPVVEEALKEREEKLIGLQHQEEEAQRDAQLLIGSNHKASNRPLIAGTLAETLAAASRWGKQTSSEDVVKMLKDSATARRASLVKYLENKLSLAKRKLFKAEKALATVQEYLQPSELPSDQEMITDEERFLFRKMGLSMKPYLLLGRRGVFDGTIQNMHLHWKFRELVKIIVKGQSFGQVKHIAISLEAESGGVFVSIDRTTKGYAIIVYRGKNYQQPLQYRPRNLLTRRQALERSIELQRLEALRHHISDLLEKIDLIKSELRDVRNIEKTDDKRLYARLDEAPGDGDVDDSEVDEGEEAYLKVYDSGDDSSTN